MGVASISGQDLSLLAAGSAAQAPDPRTRTAATRQQGVAPASRSDSDPREEQVQQAAARVVVTEGPRRAGTRMRIDAASQRIVAQIVGENNEIIRQVPPEEMLKIAARFQEVNGKLFDQSV